MRGPTTIWSLNCTRAHGGRRVWLRIVQGLHAVTVPGNCWFPAAGALSGPRLVVEVSGGPRNLIVSLGGAAPPR